MTGHPWLSAAPAGAVAPTTRAKKVSAGEMGTLVPAVMEEVELEVEVEVEVALALAAGGEASRRGFRFRV